MGVGWLPERSTRARGSDAEHATDLCETQVFLAHFAGGSDAPLTHRGWAAADASLRSGEPHSPGVFSRIMLTRSSAIEAGASDPVRGETLHIVSGPGTASPTRPNSKSSNTELVSCIERVGSGKTWARLADGLPPRIAGPQAVQLRQPSSTPLSATFTNSCRRPNEAPGSVRARANQVTAAGKWIESNLMLINDERSAASRNDGGGA